MLTILVRVKILTDALASVASVWIRACVLQHAKVIYHLVYINLKEWKKTIRTHTIKIITVFTANQRTQENQIYNGIT
jgi:hypothetical protein